ncbi:bifunctional phosphoribosyl-AMP cyclohydrolase/phosphoribosyl-ATP diphosphatase HisIE [Roseiflexus sp.]|uniref:bifunctional phosphoribosyl-AMP cyclohydrolase/phosphoribosyl-ATP diphosphatase HisIE n=1 Tax=Roseiflexus sp. TaxID=2562120 RepID=UPI0021DE2D36|nr:bifunctional phosphoribosyl-AMP cyclohydrolase/phosphoribosyl-ATP diphosphatase HisIE [Roseiflexus sp.]GIV98741.1 MAG: histidine biosynthesis bifunctional protein HisIE [Roseiflexus sp.]
MRFDAAGLIPVVVQHARSGEVLMLGYMNEEALQQTLVSGMVTFWSRSRQTLWRKGETSGNVLRLVEIRQDCDGDALLVFVEPAGPTCHTGRVSCFHRTLDGDPVETRMPDSVILTDLANIVAQRASAPKEDSYTTKMLMGGVDRIGKKIGEEAAEVIIAAKNGAPAEIAWEVADLVYHLVVLLQNQGMTLEDVWTELRRRYGG